MHVIILRTFEFNRDGEEGGGGMLMPCTPRDRNIPRKKAWSRIASGSARRTALAMHKHAYYSCIVERRAIDVRGGLTSLFSMAVDKIARSVNSELVDGLSRA